MTDQPDPDAALPASARGTLCARCDHLKLVHSSKGSTFLMCGYARPEEGFPKYPPQPVVCCQGFEETVP